MLMLQPRQTSLASTEGSFAALLGDGSVVTWRGPQDEHVGPTVQAQLKKVSGS